MLRRSRGFGKPDEAIMRDGYFLVDLTLARPEADAEKPPNRAVAGTLGLPPPDRPDHGAMEGGRLLRHDCGMKRKSERTTAGGDERA